MPVTGCMLVKRRNIGNHPGNQAPRRHRQCVASRTQFVLFLHPAQCIFKSVLDAVASSAQIFGRYRLLAELYYGSGVPAVSVAPVTSIVNQDTSVTLRA